VETLREAPNDFDLVLMDVQMPVMDGFTATRKIRGELGLDGLPIIALTAGVLHTQVEQALASGMNQVLPKPLNPEELIRAIRQHVESARGHSLPIVQLPELRHESEATVDSDDFPDIKGIDQALAYKRLQGDRDFFALLLKRFTEENADLARQLGAMLKYGQSASAAALLHKLRGQAGNFGATEFVERSQALETALLDTNGHDDRMRLDFEDAAERLLNSATAWLKGQQPTDQIEEVPARMADTELLARLLDDLSAMLTDNLLSAGKLSREIEARLRGTPLSAAYRPVTDAVQKLQYPGALAALRTFRAGAGLTDTSGTDQ
jgi:DNA-binding response OmpR family regulator